MLALVQGADPPRQSRTPVGPGNPKVESGLGAISAAESLETVRGDEWDEREAVRAAARGQLPLEWLEAGVRRLRGICGVAAIFLILYLVMLVTLVAGEVAPANAISPGPYAWALGATLLMLGLTRLRASPHIIINLGYTYLLLLCLLLELSRHAAPWPATELLRQVTPAVIPMLAFAALIPAQPTTVLWISLAAATMDPIALYLMRATSEPATLGEVSLLLTSPLIAAAVGFGISRVVYRLTQGVVKAREVGSYRLVERLGIGGMAEVWRADHRMLARPAAVKLIRPSVLQGHGPEAAERLLRIFTREARATALLRSPHTIQLYDFGMTREGAFFTVMELLDGVDLQSLVERFGPQPEARVANLMRQACHSLAEAHEHELVHRDVKPANIFVCRLGGDHDFVKVLDFGLVLDRHPTAEELEDEQRFVGTPSVMAPEMVRFRAPVDARADLYGLGCVGYWLLTGKRVFEAESRQDMLIMHAHQKPQTPSRRRGSPVHGGLEAVIMSCLEKNPNLRPQSARELSATLEHLNFESPWSQERAASWWNEHFPPVAPERSSAQAAGEVAAPQGHTQPGEQPREG